MRLPRKLAMTPPHPLYSIYEIATLARNDTPHLLYSILEIAAQARRDISANRSLALEILNVINENDYQFSLRTFLVIKIKN